MRLEAFGAFLEAVLDIMVQQRSEKRSLVAECVVEARVGDPRHLSGIALLNACNPAR